MERHHKREYSEEVSSADLVFCLCIDLIGSTSFMLGLTTPQQDRFNRSLVNQIRRHLKKLELTDCLVKFTGDGWLVMTDKRPTKVQALCCLATIMANKFQEEMSKKTGILVDKIPPLRLAICSGRDVCVELPPGNKDWVGDSARRATRASGWCKENEIVINDSVREITFHDFLITLITEKDHDKPDKWEEDFIVHSLGELRLEAAEDSEAPECFVITLETIGKIEEAKKLGLKASERLEHKASKLGIDEMERQKILRNWNRLMASVPDYSSACKILSGIQAAGLKPDIFTYNTLIKKAPDYEEAKVLVGTMRGEGIKPDVVTYSELVDKAPDYNEAKALVSTMRGEGVQPNVFTCSTLVKKAPDYDEAKTLVDLMRKEGITPNVVTYSELVDKAPDYNEAKVLVDKMREEGTPPNVFTYNTLIKKAPDYEEAKALMDTMQKEGIQYDIVSYNTIVYKTFDYNEATAWVYTMREEGILPDAFTYNTLIKKAPDYEEAKALVDIMREEGIPPDVFTYSELVDKAPDYDEAKALVDTMRGVGVQPNVYTYNSLFIKDLSGILADDILKWYLAQKYHPELPIQAAIASYRKIHWIDQALRLVLDYPHLEAARKLIREHETEALAYFRTISDHDPQHPNAEYALGVAFMELEQELEAEPHLKNALKLATAGPRKTVIKKWLRQIDGKRSHKQ